jgi:hypothetical protein
MVIVDQDVAAETDDESDTLGRSIPGYEPRDTTTVNMYGSDTTVTTGRQLRSAAAAGTCELTACRVAPRCHAVTSALSQTPWHVADRR